MRFIGITFMNCHLKYLKHNLYFRVETINHNTKVNTKGMIQYAHDNTQKKDTGNN